MPNRLISEKSPYLRQHAHNPVDWYAWGEDAFARARAENKPIFLSIGYSTCHWCHVMERESFESDPIAAILNEHFVAVKVDREERPDVDRIYMTYVQAATGSGGWPMSVFLTPELKPFFGGTYFAPDDRYGRPGFGAILQRLADAWRNQNAEVVRASSGVLAQLKQINEPAQGGMADKALLDSTFNYFHRTFDSAHGGFGDAPKFPRPVVFNFLLRYYASTNRREALDMTTETLRAMASGGMRDQLGGGFHRYSVDERWFVPHFEKMLYDQAQLVVSYVEAWQITHDEFFAGIARSTLDYVLRDMTHPSGGFFSAEDADSVIDPAHPKEKGEGAFYVWTMDELDALLGDRAARSFAFHYGVEAGGNVHNDPHQEFTGKNILFLRHPLEEDLNAATATLLEARTKRVRPDLDDKVLTSWNALMISAFAKASYAFGEPRYLDAAQRGAKFILAELYDAQTGILLRRFREGDAAIPGFLDDYAFLVAAFLDLYEADFDPAHISAAIALTDKMRELFEDPEGGFFTTAAGDTSLILRIKDDYDSAEPSGNSIALLDLLRLAHITDRPVYREAAGRTLLALSAKMTAQPVAVPQMLVALGYSIGPRREVVIAGQGGQFLDELRTRFLPNTIVFLLDTEERRRQIEGLFPAAAEMRQIDGKTTAYVCRNHSCELPVNDVSKFLELIQ